MLGWLRDTGRGGVGGSMRVREEGIPVVSTDSTAQIKGALQKAWQGCPQRRPLWRPINVELGEEALTTSAASLVQARMELKQ